VNYIRDEIHYGDHIGKFHIQLTVYRLGKGLITRCHGDGDTHVLVMPGAEYVECKVSNTGVRVYVKSMPFN